GPVCAAGGRGGSGGRRIGGGGGNGMSVTCAPATGFLPPASRTMPEMAAFCGTAACCASVKARATNVSGDIEPSVSIDPIRHHLARSGSADDESRKRLPAQTDSPQDARFEHL